MTGDDDSDDDRETLRARLAEANDTLLAIRRGDVDAVMMRVGGSDQVYTLHTADEPYRHLIEQMQEGAVVLAVSGDILYCNARFAALVGAPLELVTGTRFDRFVHPSDKDGFQALLCARGGTCRSQLIGSTEGTIAVYLSLTTTVSRDGDRLNLIVTDLRELLEAFNNRDRAERDSGMKDEFLAMLAHELRGPINAINSAVQVLDLTHTGGESAIRARDVIGRQIGLLCHLIDDLLDVDRVVSGKIRFSPKPLDMAETVRRVVNTFTCSVGLDRRIDVSAEPAWVNGDPVRLEQVLAHLLTNAIKYSAAGSLIQVALRGDGDSTVLTVEDAGIGIAAELLPLVFDTFMQGDRTLERAPGGLGIGLTFVRRLVELHGGTVEASSRGEGHGSRFTVRLRQIPVGDGSPSISSPLYRVVPRRVLLIEDNRDARDMVRLMLELAGHVVFEAGDGVRGLELLEAEHPDVAIIDIGLPGLDGYQIAARIREHPTCQSMMLLALTGYGFPDDYKRSVEAGFDHHLVKPVHLDELARLLGESVPRTPTETPTVSPPS